jgi:hypothetical protein
MARRDIGVGDRGEKSTGSLNCADIIGLFPEYFSGRLSPFQSVLFEQHRAACASCRSELAVRARATMRARLDAVPARFGQTIAPIGARLRQILFHPARVKVPLEAAGLLIAVGLAFYVSQHATTHVAVTERSAAAPAMKPAVSNSESPRPESATTVQPKPEPPHPVTSQAKAPPPAVRAQQSPRTAAPQRAVTQKPVDTQPADEDRLASSQRAENVDENSSRESAVPDVPGSSGNDKTGEADTPGVTGDSRISPDDLPYFFLYNPSMKPL